MASVRHFPFVSHLRVDRTAHVLHYRGEDLVHDGAGLALWVWPASDSVAEVPVDDRDVVLAVHGRTADYQDVTVQGVVAYRAADPQRLAGRVDFTIDLRNGQYVHEPLARVEALLSLLAQEAVLRYLAHTPVRSVLTDGVAPLRETLEAALGNASQVAEFGLLLTAVRISAVRPNPDLEKAIEAPTRERIKQEADEAAFARRALAVEKERAIAENEMQNRIEVAKREEQLVEQEGANAARRAESDAHSTHIAADAEAQRITLVEGARREIESRRLALLRDLPGPVLATIAADAFANHVERIDTLQITPDVLASLAARFGANPARSA